MTPHARSPKIWVTDKGDQVKVLATTTDGTRCYVRYLDGRPYVERWAWLDAKTLKEAP